MRGRTIEFLGVRDEHSTTWWAKRQRYVSFDPREWNVATCADFIGADRVLWASDHPDPEYDPAARQVLSQAIAGTGCRNPWSPR